MKFFSVPPAETTVPDYLEQRRALIIGAPCALATLLSSPRQLQAAMEKSAPSVELEDFLSQSVDQALQLKSDVTAAGQDRYVAFLKNAVATIEDVSRDPLSSESWKGFDPGVFLGISGRNSAFFVVQWQLAPGAFLPPHCHPKTSVCTLGLEGDSTLIHFEVEENAPSYRDDRQSEFLIRKTRQIRLKNGSTSTLTEHRDNIHLFDAGPRGARGIDVTTDYGGDGSFSFLEFDLHKPEDSAGKIYKARWIGSKI